MSSILKSAVSGLLWLAFSASLFATPLAVSFTVLSHDYPVSNGGRFQGSINGGPAFSIFCDDFQNNLSALNTPYSAFLSESSDLSKTRFGLTTSWTYNPVGGLNALDRYTLAAWLTTQFTMPIVAGNPAPTPNDFGIQSAIWTLLAQNPAAPTPLPDQPTVNIWLNNALNFRTNNAAAFLDVQSNMRIITSADVSTVKERYSLGQQEYIYVVPEPGTYLLLGGGLLAVGVLRRRRQA